jgi:hypothetical protein
LQQSNTHQQHSARLNNAYNNKVHENDDGEFLSRSNSEADNDAQEYMLENQRYDDGGDSRGESDDVAAKELREEIYGQEEEDSNFVGEEEGESEYYYDEEDEYYDEEEAEEEGEEEYTSYYSEGQENG